MSGACNFYGRVVNRRSRKRDGECATAALSLAFCKDLAPVLFDYGSHDEEPETRPLDSAHDDARYSIESLEDAPQLLAGNADAIVLDVKNDPSVCIERDFNRDSHLLFRILDRIVQQVGHGSSQLVRLAFDGRALAWRNLLGIGDGVDRKTPSGSGDLDTGLNQLGHIDEGVVGMAATMASATGSQDLLDCMQESITVGEHDVIELSPLFFVDI